MCPIYYVMSLCVFVARYNENIEWTKQLSNVIVYNKGPDNLSDEYLQKNVPNVGREGHSYYTYIYENYDTLHDYTIFLQGCPFDHSPNIIQNIKKYENNSDLNIDFEWLSERILPCDLSGCSYHIGLPLVPVYLKLFSEHKSTMQFKFGAGAQFIVSKKAILKRPRSFYLKIIKLLQNSTHPIEGFVIERFHEIIFTDP